MALKDPKARRAALHYPGGHVMGARGLLEYLFGADLLSAGPLVKTDSRGRKRLQGLLNKTAAIGGKQIIIETLDGEKYQLHYSGTLVNWSLLGASKLDKSKVLCWSTARGKKRFL